MAALSLSSNDLAGPTRNARGPEPPLRTPGIQKLVQEFSSILNAVKDTQRLTIFKSIYGKPAIIVIIIGHQYDLFLIISQSMFDSFDCFTGRVTMKTAPLPDLLLAVMLPP